MTEVLKELTCKCCGAGLNPAEEKNGVIRCVYCGAAFIKEKPDCTPEIKNYLAIAETHLDTLEFDKALTTYKKVSELDPDEPKAWFGMALAKFKVQYLHDKVYNRLQPICHDITDVTDDLFTQDDNYIKALSLATEEQKKVYEQKAQEIDEINREFKDLEKQGLDFDTFICVKVTDDSTKKETIDSIHALKLYSHLKTHKFKPFYSEIDIRKGAVGSKYEAHILYALKKSKSMIIVCGNKKYLDTKWVKNEYTRYSEMIANEEKARESILIGFFDKDIQRLPGQRGNYQGVNITKPDAYSLIEAHITKFLSAESDVKYCAACGKSCEKSANFCPSCGNKSFVATKEEYEVLRKEREKEPKEREKELEEELKRVKEELRKQQEAQRKAEEEAKREAEAEADRKAEEEAAAKRQQEQATAQAAKKKKEEEQQQKKAAEQAQKEQQRLEWERLLREQRQREAAEQARRKAEEEERKKQIATKPADFEIEKGALKKYKGNGGYVVIPDRVTSIGNEAFYNCSGLTSITIPDSITSIGQYAFSGCTGLTSITLPDSVTSIKQYAFSGCTGLTSITLPDSVTYIEGGTFSDCTGLTSITIPNSVTSIWRYAFYGCTNLKSVSIGNNLDDIGLSAFRKCNNLTTVNWNATHCVRTGIEQVYFCGELDFRYEPIFAECPHITTFNIGDNVTWIPAAIFKAFCNLTSIRIPNSVTNIGHEAFCGCSRLASVTIGNSVTNIGFEAFWGCSGLKDVYYAGSKKEWRKISIERGNKPLKKAIIHFDCAEEK